MAVKFVKFNGQVHLLEFKVMEDEAGDRALRQIEEEQCAGKYTARSTSPFA
jgi:hypothetical protein